jgi:uncharacterized protein YjbJ (UPF0337 family)
MNLQSATSQISGLIHKAVDKVRDSASTAAEGAVSDAVEKISDNKRVNDALDKLGKVASKPTSDKLKPTIIAAAVAAVVLVVIVVYAVRRK